MHRRPVPRAVATAFSGLTTVLFAGGLAVPGAAAGDTFLSDCDVRIERGVAVDYDADLDLFQAADGTLYLASDLRTPIGVQPAPDEITQTEPGVDTDFLAVAIGRADRWNRVPAWIVRRQGEEQRLWQVLQLQDGKALFAPLHAFGTCAEALRRAEGQARRDGAGIWREKGTGLAYKTAEPDSFQDATGRYVIAEGRIVSLGKTRRTRYLNFGRYWKIDVTGSLRTADEEQFDAALGRAGFNLDDLAGRFVELRGVVEEKDGPHIALRHPEQLVVLEHKRAGRDGQGNN